jgi:hypothetical protein
MAFGTHWGTSGTRLQLSLVNKPLSAGCRDLVSTVKLSTQDVGYTVGAMHHFRNRFKTAWISFRGRLAQRGCDATKEPVIRAELGGLEYAPQLHPDWHRRRHRFVSGTAGDASKVADG